MKLPIRIIVRTNVDWSNMTWERFNNQRDIEFKPQMAMLEAQRNGHVITAWNEATGWDYFQARNEIRNACEAKLKSIKGVDVTIGLANKEWLEGIRDEILIPLDDDDLIFPNVTELESAFTEGVGVVCWNRLTDYVGQRQERLTPRAYLDTCNWAVRKSYLMHWPDHLAGHFLNNHQVANNMLRKRLGMVKPSLFELAVKGQLKAGYTLKSGVEPINHPDVKEIDADYSCYYLHSASISYLLRKIPAGDMVQIIKALPLHPMLEPQPCIS